MGVLGRDGLVVASVLTVGVELVELACHLADRQVLRSKEKDVLLRDAEEDADASSDIAKGSFQSVPQTFFLEVSSTSLRVFIIFTRLQRRWPSNQLQSIRCLSSALPLST